MSSSKKRPLKKESIWPVVFAAVVFLLGVYLVAHALRSRNSRADISTTQIELTHEQKIEFYRKQLGEKLNRARTLAEHDFDIERDHRHPSHATDLSTSPSLNDLPMNYEHRDWAPREPSKFAENYKPDQKVEYALKEEQEADFWEEEAQRMFLRQYLLNARAKGYDLAIDRNYNVIVRKAPQHIAGERLPQSVETLEPIKPLRFKAPFYQPPYCSIN